MKRLKRDNDGDETVDRLSSLPVSLIFEILSFLETRDVVKTSLLSKGWKDLWTTIPYLYFDESVEYSWFRTRNFINGVLWSWRGTKILRFKISIKEIWYPSDETIPDDISLWAAFATEKKVEDLDLHVSFKDHVQPPKCLYSCSSITKLRLSGFRFQLERGINVQWDRLKSFKMVDQFMSVDMFHHLLSSTPQLQVLEAYVKEINDDISIRSSCLKRLTLRGYYKLSGNTTRLTIWTPNLEELSLLGFANGTRLLLDAPALTDVCLRFYYNGKVQFEEALEQLLLPFQHVEALTLDIGDVYKKLGLMKGKCLFSNLKLLKLICINFKPHDIGCVPDLFPKVEKLVFVPYNVYSYSRVTLFRGHDFGEKHCEEENNPYSFLMLLRGVEVIWGPYYEIDEVYKFIKLLLKDAIMMQKIVIKEVEDYNDDASNERKQKMLSLQDSFPTVNMIFS